MLIRVMVAIKTARERRRLEALVGAAGSVALVPGDPAEIWERLRVADVDLVVTHRPALPEDPGPWLATIAALPERPDVIIIADREDPDERARLLAAGALAVLYRGLADDMLRDTLATLIERRRAREASTDPASRPQDRRLLSDFVARSDAMAAFMAVARRVASSESSVLILGETGVGKERLARSLHAESPRADGPLVAVNCGALPESLLEAELFGHEQGAFTGATRSRRGYFELAHGGTLFLDEIGEVPPHLQVKLLRAIDERRIRRVGSEQSTPVDARIIAATNRRLEEDVAAGRFRADLYYRLAVVTLVVPALRDRREDIPELAESYLAHFRRLTPGSTVEEVTPDAMEALVRHDWPGNVRELINVIERGVLLCQRTTIDLDDLPPAIAGSVSPATVASGLRVPEARLDQPLRDARRHVLQTFERAYLHHVLSSTRGRIRDAAAKAGVDERSIYNLMRRHGLRKEHFKPRQARSRTR